MNVTVEKGTFELWVPSLLFYSACSLHTHCANEADDKHITCGGGTFGRHLPVAVHEAYTYAVSMELLMHVRGTFWHPVLFILHAACT